MIEGNSFTNHDRYKQRIKTYVAEKSRRYRFIYLYLDMKHDFQLPLTSPTSVSLPMYLIEALSLRNASRKWPARTPSRMQPAFNQWGMYLISTVGGYYFII